MLGLFGLHMLVKLAKPYTAKNEQPVRTPVTPDENSIEQCFAAHIVQGCQQYCSALLHLIAG